MVIGSNLISFLRRYLCFDYSLHRWFDLGVFMTTLSSMKSWYMTLLATLLLPLATLLADDSEKLHDDVKEAIELFENADSGIKKFFEESYGYAVFPKVGKGGFVVGGAYGKGEVYENGARVGRASLSQATVGLQLGGQAYIELIFFEDKRSLDNFKTSKFALSAQASAVAAAEGAAATAKYELGVAVFTLARGGLMFEASVGGQKFNYTPIEAVEE